MPRSFQAAVAAAVMMLCGSAAHASLLNDTIHLTFDVNNVPGTDLGSKAVNPTATFILSGTVDIIVSADTIDITAPNGVTFQPGQSFVAIDTTESVITGVTVDPTTNLAGFNSSKVSATASTININIASLQFLPTSRIRLDVQTKVPEPASFLLLGAGLAGLRLVRRRRS